MDEIIQTIINAEYPNAQPNPRVAAKVLSILSQSEKISSLAHQLQEEVKEKYQIHYEIESFQDAHLPIANANAKKDYNFSFNLQEFPHIHISRISHLEELGLTFSPDTRTIEGKPTMAASTELEIHFYCTTDPDLIERVKRVPFIINPDPKDLWQNIPLDKEARFYKTEEATLKTSFLDKKLVVASKRGRSHAHQGGARDDDFYTLPLPNDWQVIAVADGAGSAKFARKGSEIATHFICDSCNDSDFLNTIDQEVVAYFATAEDLTHKSNIVNAIYRKLRELFRHLEDFANAEEIALKDLHTTLIFALAKKYDFGYVLLTFGVGDCPICILNEAQTEVQLLNLLDIGEFGGGTRFITMPEIYSNDAEIPVGKRFGIHCFNDFSKLFLMTDGIYDPKFVVENNLTKIERWNDFLADLNGENDDHCQVDFQNDNQIDQQLLQWLDFWSKGNSDDRTLAIIY